MAGRPSEITQELIDKAKVWIDGRKGVERHTLLPTIEGLALELHINRDTIYDWEEKGNDIQASDLLQQFSDIIKELRAAQAEKIIQNALQTNYNPMIAKLLLSKHGYVEKSEQDITSKGNQIAPVTDPKLAAEFTEFLKNKTEEA